MLDLEAEGATLDEAAIRRLQAMKTGALIAASCEMGAVARRRAPEERTAIRDYGRALGLAFQLADDLLDVEASPPKLGKATAKDAGRGKATFVVSGREGARDLLAGAPLGIASAALADAGCATRRCSPQQRFRRRAAELLLARLDGTRLHCDAALRGRRRLQGGQEERSP